MAGSSWAIPKICTQENRDSAIDAFVSNVDMRLLDVTLQFRVLKLSLHFLLLRIGPTVRFTLH
jgi:hypothetical protein